MLDHFAGFPKHGFMINEERMKLFKGCISNALESFCQFASLQEKLRQLPKSESRAVLAIGKDAGRLIELAMTILNISKGNALCLTKYAHYQSQDERVYFMEAGHPVPDQSSIKHSRYIIKWLKELPKETELIVLLSGGGSALFELPKAGYELHDVIKLNQKLLNSGMDIRQMNEFRARISSVKAGAAANYFQGKKIRVYALSDVEDDDPEVICSGPFTKAGVEYQIIGNNFGFRNILAKELAKHGFEVHNSEGFESGNPEEFLAKLKKLLASSMRKLDKPIVLLFGGEIPIQVKGSGRGGRCTHLALSASKVLNGDPGAIFLAFASDGNDNLNEVAGAWVDGQTWDKLKKHSMDLDAMLDNSDSYSALQEIRQIIQTGEWHANVNDVYVLCLWIPSLDRV